MWRPRHSTLSFLRSSQEPSPTIVYLPLPLPKPQYHGHIETRVTNQFLTVRAYLLPLSLPLQDPRLPGPKPSLSHKALLSYFPCFLDEWSNRLRVFSFAPFRSPTLSLDSAARCCFCVCPPIFQRILRNFSPALPEETRILRVLWHLSSNFSISITFDIGCERLLIRYILKEYSRFDLQVCFRILVQIFFPFVFFDSYLSPPLMG